MLLAELLEKSHLSTAGNELQPFGHAGVRHVPVIDVPVLKAGLVIPVCHQPKLGGGFVRIPYLHADESGSAVYQMRPVQECVAHFGTQVVRHREATQSNKHAMIESFRMAGVAPEQVTQTLNLEQEAGVWAGHQASLSLCWSRDRSSPQISELPTAGQ